MAKRSMKEEFLARFTVESSNDETLFRKEINDIENEAYLRGYREAIIASHQQTVARKDKDILRLYLQVEKIIFRLDQLEARLIPMKK